jgi:membrane protease YdiL (CAAX protease family)
MAAIPAGRPWHYYFSHLLILAGLFLVGTVVFALVGITIAKLIYPSLDGAALLSDPTLMWSHPVASFILLGVTSLGSFALPSLIFPLITRQPLSGFHPLRSVTLPLLVLAAVLAMLSLSPTALTFKLNELVDVSKWGSVGEWLTRQEAETEAMFNGLLGQRGTAGFVLAMLVVAVIPALGEELFFRSVLQRLFQSWIGKHVGIILTAIIFSAIHVEFSGFLPRLFLGLLLGYVFFWTNNLWYPIAIHFVNNAFVVIAAHSVPPDELDVDEIGTPEMIFAVLGTVVFAGILYFFYRLTKAKPRHGNELDQDQQREPAPSS